MDIADKYTNTDCNIRASWPWDYVSSSPCGPKCEHMAIDSYTEVVKWPLHPHCRTGFTRRHVILLHDCTWFSCGPLLHLQLTGWRASTGLVNVLFVVCWTFQQSEMVILITITFGMDCMYSQPLPPSSKLSSGASCFHRSSLRDSYSLVGVHLW